MNPNIALGYRQGDPRWGSLLLGDSGLTVASYGCYTAVAAAVLGGTFKRLKPGTELPLDPGDLNRMLNAIGGYADGQIAWWAVQRLFPECEMWTGAWSTALQRNGNFQAVEQDVLLSRVMEACRIGLGVGLCVDAVPNNDVKPDHIVALVHAPNDPAEWIIMDPITGQFENFMQRYGDPKTKVFGYRIFSGPPTEFPPYSDADDQEDGSAFWKAVQISRGQNVATYSKEIAETLLFAK